MSPSHDVVLEAIAYVRRHYDESIFPPRPDGPHSEVYDGEAAAVARQTCDNILREIEERRAVVSPSDATTETLHGDFVKRDGTHTDTYVLPASDATTETYEQVGSRCMAHRALRDGDMPQGFSTLLRCRESVDTADFCVWEPVFRRVRDDG